MKIVRLVIKVHLESNLSLKRVIYPKLDFANLDHLKNTLNEFEMMLNGQIDPSTVLAFTEPAPKAKTRNKR